MNCNSGKDAVICNASFGSSSTNSSILKSYLSGKEKMYNHCDDSTTEDQLATPPFDLIYIKNEGKEEDFEEYNQEKEIHVEAGEKRIKLENYERYKMDKLTTLLKQVVGNEGQLNIIECSTEDDYKAVLRVKFPGKCDEDSNSNDFNVRCNEWVKSFSSLTKTQWVVQSTFPNLQKMLFRKKYVCHHSDFNKVHENKRERESTRKKGKDCGASIDIKIKKINRNTIRNDMLLKKGLSAEIKVINKHSHPIHVAEAYSFLKMTDETKEQFINYFNDGMSPSAARNFHELKLISQESDDSKITKLLADSQINPKEREIYKMFDDWRQNKNGVRNCKTISSILQDRISAYEERGVSIYVNEDPFVILILTPIMKRAHEQKFSNEICFVDSSASCEQTSTVITTIIGGSKVGGVPLACLLHTSQTENGYRLIFKILKQHTPRGFGGNGEPKIFLTDDSSAERNALQNIYPRAILLLSTFHVCQAVWSWLWDSKNRIDKVKRRKLMTDLLYIISAQTEGECAEYYLALTTSCEYEHFVNYIKCLWGRRTEWCHWYRMFLCAGGHNTNDVVEASIRFVKEIISERCKAFNAVALLDFVVNILDDYHKRRLISYASNGNSKNHLRYLKLTKHASDFVVKQTDDGTYSVTSSTDPQFYYTVIADGSLCDCASGTRGAFCKHLAAVQNSFGLRILTYPLLTEDDGQIIADLATGERYNSLPDTLNDSPPEKINLTDDPWEDSHKSQQSGFNLENDNTTLEMFKEEHKAAVDDLKHEFNRISNLAESETRNIGLIKKFTRSLKKIVTGSQVDNFFSTKRPAIRHTTIKVQRPALARRNSRIGKLSAKRVESGGPAKRRHSLPLNILGDIRDGKNSGLEVLKGNKIP